MAHPNGRQLMASHAVAEDELVNCTAIYHSPARVIEGADQGCDVQSASAHTSPLQLLMCTSWALASAAEKLGGACYEGLPLLGC